MFKKTSPAKKKIRKHVKARNIRVPELLISAADAGTTEINSHPPNIKSLLNYTRMDFLTRLTEYAPLVVREMTGKNKPKRKRKPKAAPVITQTGETQ